MMLPTGTSRTQTTGKFNIGPMVAILLMVVASLTIGHLLGGPRQDQRPALATACIARNVGLALFLAELSNDAPHFIPTILAYMILGGLLAVPYAIWSKRQLTAKQANG
jgi:BASS family bile acid:Na+ symporter